MKPAIIVDFDGTLSDTKHREHFVTSQPKQWKEFFHAADKDPLNNWCFEIILAMKNRGYSIIMLTGRPEWMRELSVYWLEQYNVPYDHLYMRADEDHRDDPIVKLDFYNSKIKPEYNVSFVLEDRQRVVDMWREHHITCLQCAVGDF
jgi:beta-phosphoglucomutase-like phosphatase (HAD superfamily)